MASTTVRPVVAIFPNRGTAEAAVHELWHEGFRKEQIGLAAPGEALQRATAATEEREETAAEGASVGALTGTAVGALAGTAVVALLPGFGPVLASGLLAGMVGGAALGAALGTFAGPFLALGVSEADVRRYESEFRVGRTIVVVQTDDRQEEALTILRSHGPVCTEVAGRRVPPL